MWRCWEIDFKLNICRSCSNARLNLTFWSVCFITLGCGVFKIHNDNFTNILKKKTFLKHGRRTLRFILCELEQNLCFCVVCSYYFDFIINESCSLGMLCWTTDWIIPSPPNNHVIITNLIEQYKFMILNLTCGSIVLNVFSSPHMDKMTAW